MSGYGYGPPPPPPPTGNASGGHPYSGGSSGHGRGGGRGRGGGHTYAGGRGNYQGSQPRYDYAGQSYQQQTSAYAGAYPPANSYGHHQQAQWAPEHGRQAQTHAPAPISSTNYHPNYTTPHHYPQGQYPQQSAYSPAQPYGTAAYQSGHPPPPQAQPHWTGQAPPGRPHAGYHDTASSGSYHGSTPARPYDASSQPTGTGYAQPYPQDPRVPHYPPAQPYPYSGPPAPPPGPRHHNAHGQQPRRGRGGHRDGGRGRGGHQGDRNRGNKPQRKENSQKTDSPSVGKKKKRKTNTLGLTPAMDSESEDDEGEETALKELIGADAMKVSDIAAFIAERRKNFPTKARMEAKKAAEEAQKKDEKTSLLERQADELRKQLRKVESSIKRKREHGDEGDDLRDPSEEGSDDDKPEVMSSRATAASTSKSLPPSKRADISRHCKYYSTGGTCGKKGKCRFVHDPEVREAAMKEREANNGRLTIQQRLVLNDKEQEDLTVLQSIQYLRQKGIMKAATPPPEASAEDKEPPKPEEQQERKAPPVKTSLLPAAPPSLPPVPPKREPGTEVKQAGEPDSQKGKHYEGWLLQPYGSKK